MPKKKKKSIETRTAESYFHIDEGDFKNATEKEEKALPTKQEFLKKAFSVEEKKVSKQDFIKGSIEKVYKKPERNLIEKIEKTKKVNNYKKKSKNGEKSKNFSIPKISLKEKGYELIITEKPQAAMKIATALGSATQKTFNKISYYELERKGKKIVVACAVGHLFTLKQNSPGSTIPVFEIGWVPNYIAKKGDFTKRYYDTILNLVKGAGSITVATDFDIEGELIGLNVVRFICNQKDANRMKFSTLTTEELNKSYEEKKQTLDWGQAIAGETRHFLDWFYGINLSRALMNAIKSTGKFKIMSIGRVQGPALNLIVKKEKEIQKFKSKQYWQIFITVKDKNKKVELKHTKDLFNKLELKKFEDLTGKKALLNTKKSEQIVPPNPPFNLTTLQMESYALYGINPSSTLKIAQSLYLAGLISYPRTSSQKLPDSIDYNSIIKKLAREFKAEGLMLRKRPVEGKKTDSAHPSIYPTGNRQILSGEEEKIYNLIVKRFLCLFCEDAILDKRTISAQVDNLLFSKTGSAIRKKAWMEIYPLIKKEVDVPDLNGEFEIKETKIEEKETQPPKRYSQASIIAELEKRNLGTKATRSSILETLYDRGYVKGKSVEATPIGISLINTLEKHSPIIIDEKLTRDFEREMDSITQAKKDFEEKEKKIIEKAKETITKISKDFEKNEKEIGKEIIEANQEQRVQERIENTIMTCPRCNKGNLFVNYSKKNRRYFIACDKYPECKNTYSLPPNGLIKRANKLCEDCGFPALIRLSKGKRPWEFCFNPQCKKNKERIEEYNKNRELKNSENYSDVESSEPMR
ncbi:MAG: DNA topoisomerase I [archaeon]